MRKTVRELAQESINVQDACNLMGVTKSFAKAVEDLFYSDECNESMSKLATHPIIVLWMDKLNDMNTRPSFEDIGIAWDYVKRLANSEEV